MQAGNYQTVKLGKGRHSSPAHGACVMELASMLAGEPFTDHPRSVSRTIAAFLRTYNDMLDDERRQDLYGFAAKCVGTAGAESLEVFRAARLVAWGDAMRRSGFWARWFGRLPGWRVPRRLTPEEAARYAALSVRRPSDETHVAVLGLVDELIAMGSGWQVWDVVAAWPEHGLSSEDVELPSVT